MDSQDLKKSWFVLSAKARIDSFNQNTLRDQLKRAQASGYNHIALDVHATRFISLAAIQFLAGFAKEMRASNGQLALLAPTEKTKRHFEIYSTLNAISIVRHMTDIEVGEKAELGVDSQGSGSSASSQDSEPQTSV